MGRYIETDKCSWLLEQAKFMRIRVDLPLNKPLCKGGNVVNLNGSKTWVTFKFKRLPYFCFQCGLLGHDEQHCASFPYNLDSPKQMGFGSKQVEIRRSFKSGPEHRVAEDKTMTNWKN